MLFLLLLLQGMNVVTYTLLCCQKDFIITLASWTYILFYKAAGTH